MSKSVNLKNTAIIVSTTLVIISMAANFAVYSSLAEGANSVIYSILGIGFDAVKIIFALCSILLWVRGHAWLAVIAGVFFLVLTAVSVFTALGFSSSGIKELEEKKAAASAAVLRKQDQLDTVTSQLNSLASVAAYNIATLKMSHVELEQQLIAERTALSKCPKNYKINCINPANAKIEALTAKVRPLANKITDYGRYQGLQIQQQVLSDEYNTLLAGGGAVSAISPVFALPATALGLNPVKVKFYFLTVSAFLLELSSSFLVIFTSVLFASKSPRSHQTPTKEHNITPDVAAEANPVKKPLSFPMGDIKGMPFNAQNGGKGFANDWQPSCSHDSLNINNTRSHLAPVMATTMSGESVQRVAAEKSQKSASGRMGKVDICANPNCDEMFLVTAHNKIYHNRSCCEAAKKIGAK